jgi:hypothetical protein
MSKNKVAILSIATGKYDIFIPDLIDSCEKNFLRGMEKKYFVFTDSNKIEDSDRLIKVYQNKIGWPFDTLLRFHMFDLIRDKLIEFDYIFFMNANLKIVFPVTKKILPLDSKCGLTLVAHPGFFGKPRHFFTYERRHSSSFYVGLNRGDFYVQGCFNGGRSEEFLDMCRILKEKINEDLSKKIIPIWHDESALNWFILEKDPLILDPTYAYPEYIRFKEIKESIDLLEGDEKNQYLERKNKFKDPHFFIKKMFGRPKIIQRDKNLFGGKNKLRS